MIEMKQKSGVSKIVDQETQINSLNLEIGLKEKTIEGLNAKFGELCKKETQYLDREEAVNFFSELLKEKDEEIQSLKVSLKSQSTIEQEKEE